MFPIPDIGDLQALLERENFDFTFELIYSAVLIGLLIVGRYFVRVKAARQMRRRGLGQVKTLRAVKLIRIIMFLLFVAVILPVWAEKLEQLGLYVASFLAVLGFAFTAMFSLLSNIPASLVLFLSHPMRIGSRITLIDGKDTITGRVTDISLFSVRLTTDDGFKAVFPNVLALQRGILVLNDVNSGVEKQKAKR